MRRLLIAGCLLALCGVRPLVADDASSDEWTSKSGHRVRASFLREEREGGKVFYVLKRKDDGREIRVPADTLTPQSRLKAMTAGGKQRRLERALAELKNFQYDKAGFGTTRTEFKKLYPDAKESRDDEAPSVFEYGLRVRAAVDITPLGKASCALFDYLDEELVCVSVVWIEEHLDEEYSGLPWLDAFKKFLDDFGRSTGELDDPDSNVHGHYWILEEIDTRMELYFDIGTGVLLKLTRRSVESKLPEKDPPAAEPPQSTP